MFWFGVGALAVVTTATGTLHIFDTLFDLTIHQLIITTLITVLGIFGNMCYTGMLLIAQNIYGTCFCNFFLSQPLAGTYTRYIIFF